MLSPSDDRLDYGVMLSSPSGYKVDCAVGTTYSLDLDALVGASLALGLSEETDSAFLQNPVFLLEALRQTGEKVALFCDGSQIKRPAKATSLYILLEKMVFPVQVRPDKGSTASFHPKMWLGRYKAMDGSRLYRIAVLSRNLTFDRSWDVTYYMDGVMGERTDKNDPLCDFLSYLAAQLPANEIGAKKNALIQSLLQELPEVLFQPPKKEGFEDYAFFPGGILGEGYRFTETELFTEAFRELLIMSPFVSSDILRSFNERNGGKGRGSAKYLLITRKHSLKRLKPEDVSRFRLFTLRDQVIDGESQISEDAVGIQSQDIHAKLYLVRTEQGTELYLGSLNASHNSFYRNVEFMLRLTVRGRSMTMEKLLKALFCGEEDNPNNPFEEVEFTFCQEEDEGEEEEEKVLESVMRTVTQSPSRAVASGNPEEGYSITLWFEGIDSMDLALEGMEVTVTPLLCKGRKEKLKEVLVFSGLTVTELSAFFVITVLKGESRMERVLLVPVEGMPQERERAVVSSVIRDRYHFYEYVIFLLGDCLLPSLADTKDAGETGEFRSWAGMPALYERMLQIAVDDPERLEGLNYVLRAVSDDRVIPEDFRRLYQAFQKAVKRNG